ncbi:UNVERIFIED_CONTAM: hypothetical protein Slati_0915500 [Sesamum latifolium]|uniref:Uncharacterized protein n=1 Tax=Sesamum latifolium TaxID=2727402 RepID=A0AAW2XPD4_9LAMI
MGVRTRKMGTVRKSDKGRKRGPTGGIWVESFTIYTSRFLVDDAIRIGERYGIPGDFVI